MKLSKKVERLIAKWKNSLEIESQFRSIRREIIKEIKGWTTERIIALWADHLEPITEEYEKLAVDAFEEVDQYRVRWQTRVWNARTWLMKQACDYEPRQYNQVDKHHVDHTNSHVDVVQIRPLDEDRAYNLQLAAYAESLRALDFTPADMDKARDRAKHTLGIE